MSAADTILKKILMPTHLDSASIRAQIAAEARRRSFFSATATRERYLIRLRDSLARVAAGEWNDASARLVIQQELDALGYDVEAGGFPGDLGLVEPAERGSLRDLSSRARIELQRETQVRMARSVAQAKAGNSAHARRAYPAWSYERIYGRAVPRDWAARWDAAGFEIGWVGAARAMPSPTASEFRMIALKDSPIWQALGDGAGGFADTLGNPYPPFAFGSGMGWRECPADEVESLGLGECGEMDADLSPGEKEISDALGDLGDDFVQQLMQELGG